MICIHPIKRPPRNSNELLLQEIFFFHDPEIWLEIIGSPGEERGQVISLC